FRINCCARIGIAAEERNAVAKLQLESFIRKDECKYVVVGVLDVLCRHNQSISILPMMMGADGGSYRCTSAQGKQAVTWFLTIGNPGPFPTSEADRLAILYEGHVTHIAGKGERYILCFVGIISELIRFAVHLIFAVGHDRRAGYRQHQTFCHRS